MKSDKKPNLNPRIRRWKPKPEDIFVGFDGGIFYVYFDKFFNNSDYATYNPFKIKKGSFDNKLELICRYINYFEKFYDTDHELIYAYSKIKHAVKVEKLFTAENIYAFRDFLYDILFTPSMIKKIEDITMENYLDDIEGADEKYKNDEKQHLESLRFTNQHVRILLSISFGMKIMSSPMYDFFTENDIKIDKYDGTIFRFYEKLFDIFNQDCDIYNKLYVYVKTKVMESNAINKIIFLQKEIQGKDIYTVINDMLNIILISDNMVKFAYSEHWDSKLGHYKENIPGFIKTIIKFQLMYFCKDQNALTFTEITNTKNADGLSGSDKMQMNLTKLDESIPIQSDLIIKYEINDIKSLIDFDITEEEIQYYRDYHYPSKIQMHLVYSYYAKFFGTYTQLNLLTRRQYIELIVLLKKKLLLELGYDPNSKEPVPAALPYILTGNVIDKVNTRMVRNSKFLDKVESSYLWEKLTKDKYGLLMEIEPDQLNTLVSTFINTRFSFVAPEFPDMLGKEILYSEDKICDELLFFLNSI